MKLFALSLIFILLSGCSTVNRTLPEPHFKMIGYITEEGYIYVIEPKSGKSIAVRAEPYITE